MFTLIANLLSRLTPRMRVMIEIALLVVAISGALVVAGSVRSCSYKKSRAEYEAKEQQLKTQRDQLLGKIEQRDREIEKLGTEKDAYKTMAEQGVQVDQQKAKQIEAIATKEAEDLEDARNDMDCVTRARDTVALLRTAKPPINLDVDAVIRKQCGPAR